MLLNYETFDDDTKMSAFYVGYLSVYARSMHLLYLLILSRYFFFVLLMPRSRIKGIFLFEIENQSILWLLPCS